MMMLNALNARADGCLKLMDFHVLKDLITVNTLHQSINHMVSRLLMEMKKTDGSVKNVRMDTSGMDESVTHALLMDVIFVQTSITTINVLMASSLSSMPNHVLSHSSTASFLNISNLLVLMRTGKRTDTSAPCVRKVTTLTTTLTSVLTVAASKDALIAEMATIVWHVRTLSSLLKADAMLRTSLNVLLEILIMVTSVSNAMSAMDLLLTIPHVCHAARTQMVAHHV